MELNKWLGHENTIHFFILSRSVSYTRTWFQRKSFFDLATELLLTRQKPNNSNYTTVSYFWITFLYASGVSIVKRKKVSDQLKWKLKLKLNIKLVLSHLSQIIFIFFVIKQSRG